MTNATTTTATAKFEIGMTYSTRSICDSECNFSFEILARTAKFVTIKAHGEIVKRGISIWNNAETFAPHGRYSMAPVISAN